MNGLSVVESGQCELPANSGDGLVYRILNPASSYQPPGRKMYCPKCEKRAFDVSGDRPDRIEITLKCPNCGKFVRVYVRNPLYC